MVAAAAERSAYAAPAPRPAVGFARAFGDARRAVVGGCGRTGAEIAVALCEAGCEVTVLDTDPTAFERLAARLGASGDAAARRPRPLVADVTLESRLRAAGAQDADAFFAVVRTDAANALAAQIAFHILRIPLVVCRIDDPIKREMYESMDIKTVSRVSMFADQAIRRLEDG